MRVQVIKIQDLARGTHSGVPQRLDPDKTGPVPKGKNRTWVGKLRRFKDWFGKYALHDPTYSFDDAFRRPGSRLIVKGPVDLITGPIVDYRIFREEVTDEQSELGDVTRGVEKKAVVRTINSVYEVTALPNSDYVEKVIGQESLAQQREADKNDGGDSL